MSGLPWIPLYVDFPKGPKAIALGVALQDPRAWSHVVMIWTEAAKHAADGCVNGPAAVAILEQWACWNGSPGALVEAMCLPHVRLLDHTDSGFVIHDWSQHCGAHVEKREKDRARMRKARFAKRARTVREQSPNVRREKEKEKEKEMEKERETEEEKETETSATDKPSPLSLKSMSTAVSPSGTDTLPTPPPVAVSEQRPPASGIAEAAWGRVAGAWELHCVPVGFARPRGTAKQRKEAATRCRDPAWFEAYESACRFLARTPFYRGKNDRGWTATISWVMQAGKAEELAEKSETTKAPKGTIDAESAAIHQAFLDAEREFAAGAPDRGNDRRCVGRGSESRLPAAPPSLPLPADGEGLPSDVLSLLGNRRAAGALQNPSHVDDGDEHGPSTLPGPVRVAGVDPR